MASDATREPEALPAERTAALPVPAGERGLERADALTRYLAQLREHPPISRE